MSDENGLENFMQNPGTPAYFGQGLTESETRAAIAEIEAETPLTGVQRTIKQLCISLAMSIDKGNMKGRAIANEASQLFAMMTALAPPAETQSDDSRLSTETKRLLDVFEAPAKFDAAPEGDAS